jgi:GxxExxY protein
METVLRFENRITESIIGAAIEVHRELGPGLLESAYRECLCHELSLRKLQFEYEVPLPIRYKTVSLDCGYRMDVIVENQVILELKTVEKILPIHEAQLLTYLKLYKRQLGLLINFHVPVLKDGIKRIVNNF